MKIKKETCAQFLKFYTNKNNKIRAKIENKKEWNTIVSSQIIPNNIKTNENIKMICDPKSKLIAMTTQNAPDIERFCKDYFNEDVSLHNSDDYQEVIFYPISNSNKFYMYTTNYNTIIAYDIDSIINEKYKNETNDMFMNFKLSCVVFFCGIGTMVAFNK